LIWRRDVILDEVVFPFSNPSSNFAKQPGDSSFNLNSNHLQNLLPVNSVHAAPSNAEDPSNVGTTTSPEHVTRAQWEQANSSRVLHLVPNGSCLPREICRVHMALEILLRMQAQ
jgi:hypothetical protein